MNNILFLERPSKYFWTTTSFTLLLWLIIGPLKFRHVDDFGPLEWFLSLRFEQFYFFLKHGWGTYPPIWNALLIPSAIFKGFGIDVVRNLTLIFGFISTIFSAYLTFLISNFFIKFQKNGCERNFATVPITEILSIVLNCLNPLIFLHSNSYMPYNLAIITSQLIIILFIVIPYKNIKVNYFTQKTFIIAFIFSIFFSFQSIFLITAAILHSLIFNFQHRKKSFLKNFNFGFLVSFYRKYLFFKNKKIYNFVFSTLILICTFTYCQKLIELIFHIGASPGGWSGGRNSIFVINLESNNFSSYFYKIIYSTFSIIGQATYPLPFFQFKISILVSILFFISIFLLCRLNKIFIQFSSLTLFIFLITIIASSNGSFMYSPSRHTMYLYPFIWIPLIVFLVYFSIKFFNKKNNILFLPLLGLIIFYACSNYYSISLINYSNSERDSLLALLEKADYSLLSSYDKASRFDLHGTRENISYKNKLCKIDYEKTDKPYTVFLYSHRFPIDIMDHKQRDILNSNSGNCLPNKAKLKILEKIEKINTNDIEQNINIQNGGSNIFAYLVEIS